MKRRVVCSKVLLLVCLTLMLTAGSVFALDAGVFHRVDVSAASNAQGKKLEITNPEKNGYVDGYFLPVSWRDMEVEASSLTYPDNYAQSGKTYIISIMDPVKNVLLERTVENLNYYVFSYDEIRDVLERDTYFIRVETEDVPGAPSPPIRVFYDKPYNDPPPYQEGMDVPLDAEISPFDGDLKSFNALSYTTCSSCFMQYWPGYVVIYVNATHYTKNIRMYCNSISLYNQSYSSSYSGPIFLPINAGYNYNVTYNDYRYSGNRCINVRPYTYTIIQFP